MNLDVRNAISTLVETVLTPSSGKDGRGLYIHLDCRTSNYKCYREVGTGKLIGCDPWNGPSDKILKQVDAWPIDACAQIHLLFLRYCGSTQVYSIVSDSWEMPATEKWVLQSDHGSCWRTDGMSDVNQITFKLQKQVLRPELDNSTELDQHCFMHTQRVTIKTERGPDQFGPGRRKVVEVTPGWPDGTEAFVQ